VIIVLNILWYQGILKLKVQLVWYQKVCLSIISLQQNLLHMIDIESVLTIVNFSPAYTSGCVGIRCVFCKDLPDGEKAGQHGEYVS